MSPSSRPTRSLPTSARGLIAVGVLVGSIALAVLLISTKPVPRKGQIVVRPPTVRTITLRSQDISRTFRGHGQVRALRSADISAEVSARVIARAPEIEDGARIHAGGILLQLDPADFENRLQASGARLDAIDAQGRALTAEEQGLTTRLQLAEEEVRIQQAEYDRAVRAVRDGGGTQGDIDRALAPLKRATREAEALRQALESIEPRREQIRAQHLAEERAQAIARGDVARTTVRSPIEGYIQHVDAQRGEWVPIGTRLARIVALDRLEVPLRLPISAAGSVRVGDDADVTSDSPMGGRWEGHVSRIAPEADAATRSLTVFVEITQTLESQSPSVAPAGASDAMILPGQYVKALVRTRERSARLLVPRHAVLDDAVFVAQSVMTDAGRVFIARRVPVVVAGHIDARFPEIDEHETQWAVLDSGPHPGDRVIVTGVDELSDGVAVEIPGAGP